MSVIELTDSNWDQEVLNANLPVLVDIFAHWCRPCRLIAPIIEEIESDYNGRMLVGHINIDDNPIIKEQYSINIVPTILIFKNGTMMDSLQSYQTKLAIEELVNPFI